MFVSETLCNLGLLQNNQHSKTNNTTKSENNG